MSFIDDIEIYNDPILARKRRGTVDDPYKNMVETLTVEGGKVVLTEIPNRKERVIVKDDSNPLEGLYETENMELVENTFSVDYPNGIVYLHQSMSNRPLTFTYLGEGARFFPSSRIWVENEDKMLNAKDKFKDVDRLIKEQKNRVDEQIRSVPQPSEVVDMRVDRNGNVYSVAKERIDAEQLKIDTINQEIISSLLDLDNISHLSLKERLDYEQLKVKNLQSSVNAIESNIVSLEDSLTLKVDGKDFNGENIISMIEMTPDEIKISADKINLNGAVGINTLDPDLYDKINETVSKSSLNINGELPTSIMMDLNGITAYTSDATKYARLNQNGLYVKNGAITVERPDGFQVIVGGKINHEFNLGTAQPPWTETGVTTVNGWWNTNSTEWRNLQAFYFRHTARYVQFDFGAYVEGGGSVYAILKDTVSSTTGTTLAYYSTDRNGTNIEQNANFVVDLGVPDGSLKALFLKMRVSATTSNGYVRTTRQFIRD